MLPAPDSPLDQLVSPSRSDDGFALTFPDGWQQGRGAFGGLVAAVLVRTLEEAVANPQRTLRSLTLELCGPTLPGPVQLRPEILRAGNAVTTAACRLIQSGEIQAHAVGVFGKPRLTDRDALHLETPQMAPWEAMEPLPVEPPMGPDFARFFEYRSQSPLPFSGAADPRVEGWIRPKRPGLRRDAALIAACMDAWWPAQLTVEDGPRPMATLAFTLQLCGGLEGLDPRVPFYFRSRDVVVQDGFFVELRELWGADGRLIALNQQTFAIIK
ncbi:MAG: thioesterase family protein [Myxococcota bacterium]|nr:thioesterase family protein [Myxococcota bacterium]